MERIRPYEEELGYVFGVEPGRTLRTDPVEEPADSERPREDKPDEIPEDGLRRDWLDRAPLFASEELTP